MLALNHAQSNHIARKAFGTSAEAVPPTGRALLSCVTLVRSTARAIGHFDPAAACNDKKNAKVQNLNQQPVVVAS